MTQHSQKRSRLGNYQLVKQLGKGGFAVVYLGKHMYLPRYAAIKLLLHTDAMQLGSSALESFLTEARTIASLEHPHIIRVQDFGVEDTMPYLIMDHAPNGSLQARHASDIPLDADIIVAYVKQVAAALQYAHNKNVVHCDVKPENMLLSQNNEVLLGDFGIAVVIHKSLRTGDAMGTIHYMAPEQFAGKPCLASDQYGLGIVVYKWLCGHFPFNGRTPIEMWHLHKEASPPSLRKIVPTIPAEVERVVMKALAKTPAQRFPSIQDFASALEEAMQPKRRPPVPPKDDMLPTSYLPSLRSLLPKASDLPQTKAEQDTKNAKPSKPLKDEPPVDEEIDLSTLLPLVPRVLPIAVATVQAGHGPSNQTIYRGHAAWVSAVAWAPNGEQIASGSWDKTLQVWDATTLQTILTSTGHTNTLKAVAWSPDGAYVASGAWDNTVRLMHVATGDELPLYDGHSAQVEDVAWSPNGVYIASAGHDGTVQVWKSSNRRTICTFSGHTETVWSLVWSPDGQLIASASQDGSIQVWQAMTGQRVLTYEGHTEHPVSVSWAPDGYSIASSSSDGIIQVWAAATGSTLFSYSHEKGVVKALQWSPSGKYLASAVKVVDIWDTQVGQRKTMRNPVFTYEGHSAWINDLSWSPDGQCIASASDDQTVQVWRPSY